MLAGVVRVAVLPLGPPLSEAGGTAARLLSAHLAAAGLDVVDPERVAGTPALAEHAPYDAHLAARAAEEVGATVAVFGVLSSYREREDAAAGAESPAAVAYEVAVVRAVDATVLAVDRFEHTGPARAGDAPDPGESERPLTRREMLDQALRRSAERLARSIVVAPAE